MAINPALIRAAVYAATDKRTWMAVGSVLAGVIFCIIAICAAFVNIFSPDAAALSDSLPECREFISSMQICYGHLDENTTAINAELNGESLDKEQIHSVFYTLYFSEDKNFTDDFYRQFVECFIERTSENSSQAVTISALDSAYSKLERLTGKTITQNHRRQIDELHSVLIYSGQQPNDTSVPNIGGAPAEAYNDTTFRQLMTEAEKYLGYPYVWGGSSPTTSFDCSGFICWVYTKSGVYNLPRTTAQGIYNQTKHISSSEAKPGDLVFFTHTYISSTPVTHIGIYIGDGKMLHCGNPIQYASITTEFWRSHFYGFGRLQ